MTWVRISDDFIDHPKVVGLGGDAPIAITLWLAALGYCNRYLTDGFVPAGVLGRLTTLTPAEVRLASEALVDAGLWEKAAHGYQFHDYADYQLTKEAVLEKRQQNRERMARFRNADRDAVGDAATNATPIPTPNPIPIPPPIPSDSGSRVVEEYVRLYGRVTSQKERWLLNIAGQWPEERVIEGLRYEQSKGASPKDICGRLEKGLKTGDQLNRLGAA